MFAPTSAFKTMVDGQGLIPKNKNTEMKAAVAKTLGLFSYMFVEKDLRKPERIYWRYEKKRRLQSDILDLW